ncbi:MAG TPA: hypothetical protein VEC09_07450 [Actinomycetota bacterium]|nr:hypothetical protein [Actinomycetota bacterium]
MSTLFERIGQAFPAIGLDDGRHPAARPPTRSRGAVIAFVGSEATGKSTILGRMHAWLSESHRVDRIHAGKPPATALTYLPHVLLPMLRGVFPEQRLTRVERRYAEPAGSSGDAFPLLFGLRAVMLGVERRALLRRAAARAACGVIVLSDRYPSSRAGAPDGPQLAHLLPGDPLRRGLAALETRLYDAIPSPDLVVALTAPLEVTLARNASRSKTEPEDYVRFRHARSAHLEFDGVPVLRIDTHRPLDTVVDEVRNGIDRAVTRRSASAGSDR